jgi:hypothetical protein
MVVESFFGLSEHHYVYDKKFSNPSIVLAPSMITKLGKINGAYHVFLLLN